MKWYLICQLPGVTAAALPLLATDSSTLSPALGKECAAAGSSNISAAETKGRKDVGGGRGPFLDGTQDCVETQDNSDHKTMFS